MVLKRVQISWQIISKVLVRKLGGKLLCTPPMPGVGIIIRHLSARAGGVIISSRNEALELMLGELMSTEFYAEFN